MSVVELGFGVCKSCGQTDKTINKHGVCLECIVDLMKQQGSGKLMALALGKALGQVDQLVISHASEINGTFVKSSDGVVKIGITIDLSSKRVGRIDVKTGISFIESKVKDDSEGFVTEDQENLPLS